MRLWKAFQALLSILRSLNISSNLILVVRENRWHSKVLNRVLSNEELNTRSKKKVLCLIFFGAWPRNRNSKCSIRPLCSLYLMRKEH